jgi:asparagine synthase (glutamine-hydrolysing)
MSVFFGVFDWSGRPVCPAARQRVLAALAPGGGEVASWCDANAWIAWSDFGVMRTDRTLQSRREGVGCIAGDALLAGGDDALFTAMATADMRTLSDARGQYAAAIWQPEQRLLRLSADQSGTRPLYVLDRWSSVAVATSMGALRAWAGNDLAPDEAGLAELVAFNHPLGDRTTLRDVTLLRGGELRSFAPGRREISDGFDLDQPRHSFADQREALEALHAAFAEAVRLRSRAAVEYSHLSGGMDSRAVVTALRELGRDVRSFSISRRGSADDVLSVQAAQALGSQHEVMTMTAAERWTWLQLPYDLQLRRRFEAEQRAEADRPLAFWNGHGGNCLGHVYIDEAKIALAAPEMSTANLLRLFPTLQRIASRAVAPSNRRTMLDAARAGAQGELARLADAPPERRLWLFQMRNSRPRHQRFAIEALARSRVEPLTPLFDLEVLRIIVATPISWCLRHALYNAFLAGFRLPAASVPWQSYPGHEPCPLPLPTGIRSQWEIKDDTGPVMAAVVERLAPQTPPAALAMLDPLRLRAALVASRLGLNAHHIRPAHRLCLEFALTRPDAWRDGNAGQLARERIVNAPAVAEVVPVAA